MTCLSIEDSSGQYSITSLGMRTERYKVSLHYADNYKQLADLPTEHILVNEKKMRIKRITSSSKYSHPPVSGSFISEFHVIGNVRFRYHGLNSIFRIRTRVK